MRQPSHSRRPPLDAHASSPPATFPHANPWMRNSSASTSSVVPHGTRVHPETSQHQLPLRGSTPEVAEQYVITS
jgi:hypothetical protein